MSQGRKSKKVQELINKGTTLGKLGKHDEAIKCFDKAIKLNPNYEKAWNNKGVALDNLGKHDEAIKCYDKAIKLNPNDEDAWYNKGLALDKLGKDKEAIKSLIQAFVLVRGITAEENYAPKPAKTPSEECEIVPQFIENTEKRWIRVALAQIGFSLEFNKPPKEFGYTLLEKQKLKTKIFKTLDIAAKNKVDIICFPELCASQEWIEEVKNRWKDIIIVFGSYYKDGFNTCPIIIGGEDYPIQKINSSPHLEKEFLGRCMRRGKRVPVFQTKFGRFVVLICMDFKEEIHRILRESDEKNAILILS